MTAFKLSRRKFLWTAGITGGGLVVGVSLMSGTPPLPLERAPGDLVANAFIQITPDNVVRFYCPRDEMGQGIATGLATLVAEELDVPPADLDIRFAGVHPDYDNPAFGMQATGGSTSMRAHFEPLRQAAANVRALLLQAAAADLGTTAAALTTADAHVMATGRRLPYGQFVATASGLPLPEDAPLRRSSEFRYIGKDFPRLDGLAKSTGTATFGIDVEVPGMVHAVVKRSPVPGGTPLRVDKAEAEKMPGVVAVVPIASGVAVVAERFWQARQAAQTLAIEWSRPAAAGLNSAELRGNYERALNDREGVSTQARGDVGAALASAVQRIESDYWAPYLAHAPMEPMNALVRIADGEADVWSGTQGPGLAQGLVARHAGLSKDKVRVHSTYLGGGFGRRGALTHVVEATELALATGKPVKVIWTREDDLRHGFFRPASLMRIRAGVDADGVVSGWHATRVGGNILAERVAADLPALFPAVPQAATDWIADTAGTVTGNWIVDSSSVEGLYGDYDVSDREVRHISTDDGLPLTYWRSVGHSYTAFAKECAMDELAHLGKFDVVDFRLRNLRANPRLANVVKIAGERMRAMELSQGRSLGLAAQGSFESFVAQVAEVSVVGNAIRVHRVLCVVDCGLAVNPDIVVAQMEGAIMFGLTAALYGDVVVENGAVQQSNFHDYPILRMHEAPAVDVVIVDSDAPPTGVGEPGLPPIAPAVANAVFAATGRRLRSLPLVLA